MGDIDLLHPPRELEQRRHKLKRLVQSPNSFFMDVKCPGCFNMCARQQQHPSALPRRCASSRRALAAEAERPLGAPLALSQHDGVQPRADRRHLQRLLDGAVPADWRQGPPHRGLLVPEEGARHAT